jgi:stress response protein YsnF
MEKKVLSKEEIQSLTDIKEKYRELVDVLGANEMQIMNLELVKEQIKSNLVLIKEEEIKIGKELEEKYGNGTISLESGEFSPTE